MTARLALMVTAADALLIPAFALGLMWFVAAAYVWATRPSDPRDLVARAHNRQETRP